MELYNRNEELCCPGKEFSILRDEFFPQGHEFFPKANETYAAQRISNTARKQNSLLLWCYLMIAALVFIPAASYPTENQWIETKVFHPVVAEGYRPPDSYGLTDFFDEENYFIEWHSYVIQRGDTLWDIAEKSMGNGLAYRAIAEKNGLNNPHLIFPGQTFSVPFLHPRGES